MSAGPSPREPAVAVAAAPAKPRVSRAEAHPIRHLIVRRVVAGLVTLLVVSVVVFLATQVLPGNAAFAVLGRSANPVRLHALERQLHLDRSIAQQYWIWLSGLLTGNLGTSLANGQPPVGARLATPDQLRRTGLRDRGDRVDHRSGGSARWRRCARISWFDHVTSVTALAVTSLPEFVVAIGLIILLATVVSHLLPAVSPLPPGTYA
jgi:peptide/nickel transport system permease protein